MRVSLKLKMIFAFLAVTLVLLGLVSLLFNVFLNRQFQEYIMEGQKEDNQAVVRLVEDSLNEWEGEWDASGIAVIGTEALDDGLILRFTDQNGTILWDATEQNSSRCAAILSDMDRMMQGHRGNGFTGGYQEETFPLDYDGTQWGTLTVGYYGPYSFTQRDLDFLSTTNRSLLAVGLVALLLAFVLGIWMANNLARPIKRVTSATREIADGNLKERIRENSTTKEIAALTGSVNDMADALEKQETMRKQLTADVAHELRTPLATLQSHIEALIDGVWEPTQQRFDLCHEEVIRLAGIVKSLEELTKYDHENVVLNRINVDMQRLLGKVAERFEAEARQKKISLSVTGNGTNQQDGFLMGDADKLTQALINLVSNAVKYTAPGGRITLTLEAFAHNVRILVADTGIGIPQEDLPYVFERFFRADPSRNKDTGGRGIGLAIAKSIVEAHGGRISVESKQDEGSTFIVMLPKVPPKG